MVIEKAAPVNRIGAVSPAARETCRITPVRIPLIELGRTTVRIVCQRLAPMFQQASRNAIGTLASASRVLVIMTGSVITASVQDAASTDFPMSPRQHERPDAKQAMDDARHAGKIDHGQIHDPRKPVVAGIFVEINAGQHSDRRRGQQRQDDQAKSADQRRPNAARRHVVSRILQDEAKRQYGPGLDNQHRTRIATIGSNERQAP